MKNIYTVEQGGINRLTKMYDFKKVICFSSFKKAITEAKDILNSQGISESEASKISMNNNFIDVKDHNGDNLRIVITKRTLN